MFMNSHTEQHSILLGKIKIYRFMFFNFKSKPRWVTVVKLFMVMVLIGCSWRMNKTFLLLISYISFLSLVLAVWCLKWILQIRNDFRLYLFQHPRKSRFIFQEYFCYVSCYFTSWRWSVQLLFDAVIFSS